MNKPRTVDGLLAWEIATRVGGQWRAIPGAVIGLDMTAVFAIGSALGVPPTVLAEFMPSIEAVAIKEFNKRSEANG